MNVVASIILFIGFALCVGDICVSLDCIGGNHAACEKVAGRYGSSR